MTPTTPPQSNEQLALELLDQECPGHPDLNVNVGGLSGEWRCNCRWCLVAALDAAEARGREQERAYYKDLCREREHLDT